MALAGTTSQKLPQKESGIFKKIVKCYECKQYKNGLKFSKQILGNSKFSEHGETLAMKGLIMNCLGKKDEAFELVRRGLKNDLKSHVCWHVYGLLQRADKKYFEAIKCYRTALKLDKENIQILRDLSLLQIQMRDLEGFRDTRYQLLKVRPAQRSSWVGYALSYHLLKEFEMSLKVMAEYRKTQSKPTTLPDYEFSEMILYEVQLFAESGRSQDALRHLEEYKGLISDKLTFNEVKGEILLKAEQFADAETLYFDLLKRNPENYKYYEKLELCLKLTTEEERLQLYDVLLEQFPRSHVCKRIPLGFTSGEVFRTRLDKYLRPPLHKGVPSLFMGLKSLYNNKDKVKIIEETITSYLNSLEKCSKFHPDDPDPEEPPTVLLWVLVFLAQHYDLLGKSVEALQYIEKAIDHTPTHIELYMIKSKIMKNGGDDEEAAKWMEEARTLDTADRYVNCKCVKSLLKINEIDKAIDTAGLFTRESLPPLQMLNEMQCMWFETGLARAYWRTGRFGEALVKYHEIEKHFVDIIEDQFDFHTYCMRKMTLRPYTGVLRLEDTLRNHKAYFRAAQDVIELYLYLHDNPKARQSETPITKPLEEEDLSHLSEQERKKAKRKQRKAKAKAQAKADQEKEKENKPHGKHSDDKKAGGIDESQQLKPKDLLNAEDMLAEAIKFLVPLQSLCSDKIETHLLAYGIHSRRRKYLLMLQALKRASVVDPSNPKLHIYIADFILSIKQDKPDLPDPVRTVIDETITCLTSNKSLEEFNNDFMTNHPHSIDYQISGAQVLYKLNQKEKALEAITNLTNGTLESVSLEMCLKVLKVLESGALGDCAKVTQSFCSACHARFPLAAMFKPPMIAPGEDAGSEAGACSAGRPLVKGRVNTTDGGGDTTDGCVNTDDGCVNTSDVI